MSLNSEGDVQEFGQLGHLSLVQTPWPAQAAVSALMTQEKRLWLVDETLGISSMCSQTMATSFYDLGEKKRFQQRRPHYDLPRMWLFLPDGKILIADGLGANQKRIVVRGA